MEKLITKPETGISNTLFLSDLHPGARNSVCPEHLGGLEIQHKQAENYIWCLDRFAEAMRGEKFFIMFGGEMIEGDWSKLNAELFQKQFKILDWFIDQIRLHVNDEQIVKSYLLEANQAHTGKLNAYQEILEFMNFMDKMKVVPCHEYDSFCWPEIDIVYPNDCVLNTTHYFNATNIYEHTAYIREYKETAFEHAKAGLRTPDVLYRAHVHRGDFWPLPSYHPRSTVGVFTTPGWTLKNEYVRKKPGLRSKKTHFGLAWSQIKNVKGKDKFTLDLEVDIVKEDLRQVA